MKDAAKDAVQHLMINNSMLTLWEHGGSMAGAI